MSLPEEYREEISQLLGIRTIFHLAGIGAIWGMLTIGNIEEISAVIQFFLIAVLIPLTFFLLHMLNTSYEYEKELEKKYNINNNNNNE